MWGGMDLNHQSACARPASIDLRTSPRVNHRAHVIPSELPLGIRESTPHGIERPDDRWIPNVLDHLVLSVPKTGIDPVPLAFQASAQTI